MLTPEIYTTPFGESLPYRLHQPATLEDGKRYPLVLFFHGAGERGNDNERQLKHGVTPLLDYAKTANEPLFLIAPQCPCDMQWVNTPWWDDAHTMPEFPSTPLRLTIELTGMLMGELPIDPDRVYVTGISMGGFGTWDLIQRKPGLFAAAVPVCGGGDTAEAGQLTALPLWTFHGDQDTAVKTLRTRAMIEAITKAGGEPRYTELKDVGHNAWDAAYSDEDMLAWFFAQRRKR